MGVDARDNAARRDGSPPARRRRRCAAPASPARIGLRGRACRRAAAIATARGARRRRSARRRSRPSGRSRLAWLRPRAASAGLTMIGDEGAERPQLSVSSSRAQRLRNGSMTDTCRPVRRETLKRRGIAPAVLAWWDVHRRELPWRAPAGRNVRPLPGLAVRNPAAADDGDGRRALLSRIRAALAGRRALAAASLEEVIQAFAGLGYYSRARNLHACAKAVAAAGGVFPSDEAALRALAGRRPLYGRGGRGHRLRPAGRAGRRQYRAHPLAAVRVSRRRSPPTAPRSTRRRAR